MRDIIIAGAGGFGREIFFVIKGINKLAPTWNVIGYINDIPVDLAQYKIDVPLLGTIKDWQPKGDELYIIGISSPQGREKVASLLASRGAKFATIIGNGAVVTSSAEIGEGCVITYPAVVGDSAKIGRFVNIFGSMIGQDAEIGDFSTTTGYSNVTTAKIGKRVFVGSHAVILNGRKVGDDAFVCAGSIVFHNIKAGTKVMGNPAKKVNFDF